MMVLRSTNVPWPLGHRVEAARGEGMAAQQPARGQEPAAPEPVPRDRLVGVGGAARSEATVTAEMRREQPLVEADRDQDQGPHQGCPREPIGASAPASASRRSMSSASSWCGAPMALRKATITNQ